MEKIEKIFKQLSELYEFNRKLKTYKIQTSPKIKGQQWRAEDVKKRGGADAANS